MASTDKKTKSSASSSSSSSSGGLSLTKLYLAAYNGASALGWSYLLYLALEPIVHGGIPNSAKDLLKLASSTYARAGPATALVQSCAALEIVHALFGWVRSPVVTTAMQVASRLFLVWGVTELFPSTQTSPLYFSMLLAWSTTEVLRYTFYLLSILGAQPKLLTWLRYTTFYVLYPLGAGSEAALIFTSLPALRKLPLVGDAVGAAVDRVLEKNTLVSWAKLAGPASTWGVWDYARLALFIIWWPGLYVMYTYMIKQRRKVLGGGAKRQGDAKKKRQ